MINSNNKPNGKSTNHYFLRMQVWFVFFILICSIFTVRLFYLQIIKHNYYKQAALKGQYKEYEIPAKRGIIEAYDGDNLVPIVLNEKKYTLFVDPKYVSDKKEVARKISEIINGDNKDIENKINVESRYVVIAKKLDKLAKDKVEALNEKGVGVREEEYRSYPQGQLAASILGFVNDDGEGKYGIEQYLDKELKGISGQLKAITDAQGVPIVSNRDNIITEPQQGKKVTLTIDVTMQKQVEDLLKAGVESSRAKSGSVIIIDANSGAIKAMANYPTYNPGEFSKVENAEVFINSAVGSPLEVGSVMKPLTAAAALNSGAVNSNTSYYDSGQITIDGKTITNVEEVAGPGTRSIADILKMSLNTGATYLLKQMGGGEINDKARNLWHEYMTKHYYLGQLTGIEQGYESEGVIPNPNEGYGLNIQYANTSFGQGMTATPLQMGLALASVVNGGTYYKGRLVDQIVTQDGTTQKNQPKVLNDSVVSDEVGKTITSYMEQVVIKNNPGALRNGFSVGGKTGTAQIPNPAGGYYTDRYNGMYYGFVGGDKPEYIIVVRIDEPKTQKYAGRAAQPIFTSISNMLIDNFNIKPKSQ